jgi:hypothetical protein
VYVRQSDTGLYQQYSKDPHIPHTSTRMLLEQCLEVSELTLQYSKLPQRLKIIEPRKSSVKASRVKRISLVQLPKLLASSAPRTPHPSLCPCQVSKLTEVLLIDRFGYLNSDNPTVDLEVSRF